MSFSNLYKPLAGLRLVEAWYFLTDEQEVVENFVDFCESDLGSEIMDREAEFVGERISDKDNVLDLGCGIGSIEERLDRRIVGLDSSMRMLQEAGRRSKSIFVRGSSDDMPFPDDSFDMVFSIASLGFLEDYRESIDEVLRVLKPGGRVLFMVLNPESEYFNRHMEQEESYFHGFKNEPEDIEAYTGKFFDVRSHYFLGIEGKKVFGTEDHSTASLYVVEGELNDI